MLPLRPVVVDDADGDAGLLDGVLAAVRTGAPVAVVDAAWPTALRSALEQRLTAAVTSGRVGPGDLVLGTSGSSGVPRAVVRSVASWDAALGPLAQVTGTTGRDVVWLPGPLTSTLSLYGAWHATGLAARVLLRGSPDVSAATVVHTTPSGLSGLAADPGRVPALRVAVVAGDRLTAAVRGRATDHGWDVVEYYGAAELSFVGHRRDDGAFTPFASVEVRADDGVLWVRSPYLSRGYLGGAADSGGPWRSERGWATVGDAGAVDAGGVVLTGRGDDAVVTGGWTVPAADVEAHLARVPGVDAVVVVGVPDERLGHVVCAVVGGTATPDALRHAVSGLPAASRPRRWLLLDELPVTPAGKVSRADVRDRLADGRLPRPGALART